jgi:hypothetical protein
LPKYLLYILYTPIAAPVAAVIKITYPFFPKVFISLTISAISSVFASSGSVFSAAILCVPI